MEENKKKAYSEIVEILKLIEDEEKLSKIPFEVIQMFKNNADPEYKPTISMETPLEEQNLMNETYSILGFIATKYWQDTLEEEKPVQNVAKEENVENIEEIEEVTEELVEKIEEFKEENDVSEIVEEKEAQEENKLSVLVEDIKWYKKIKDRIIAFLNKIFSRKKKNIEEGV